MRRWPRAIDVRRRPVVLHAIAGQFAFEDFALVVLDAVGQEFGLVTVRALLVGQPAREGDDVQTTAQDDDLGLRRRRLLPLDDLFEDEPADDEIGVVTADEHANRHAGALLDDRRRLDALDEHLILVGLSGGQRQDVDLDAERMSETGLLLGVAEVLVAVADEDDALAGIVGEGGQGQLQGGGDVGVIAVRRGRQFFQVEARGIAGRQFQARPSSEDDQAGPVALVVAAAPGHGIVDELADAAFALVDLAGFAGGILDHLLRDAQRAIDDEEDGDVIVRLAQLRLGERQ